MAMAPGTVVGGYRVEKMLGAGGMGSVYLAKHPSLPRMDALKVLSPELSRDPEFRARFEREANLAAGLDHPNIVSVYNRGEEDGNLWIAMQYVEGTDASAEVARAPSSMNPVRALRIITEVGKGLDYAHRKGLLHRDVKPANFLLSKATGDDERVLLTDFGVAKSSDDASELTQTGSFLATIAYAPPEQLSGAALDHRADIYSLACAFFKLLTGQNPFPAAQPAMVMMGHLHEPPPRATMVSPRLPHAIDGVFAKAMAKNPGERFSTCREFTDAAASVLMPAYVQRADQTTSPTYPIQAPVQESPTGYQPTHSESQTPPPTTLDSFERMGTQPVSRNRTKWLSIGAAAAAVIIAATAGVIATQGGSSDENESTAQLSGTSGGIDAVQSAEQAREANPGFAGKTVAMVDVTGGDAIDMDVAIYLAPTAQTDFLNDLGLVYRPTLSKNADEPSPRSIPRSERFGAFSHFNDGYILAVRSDSKAGGGGMLGLPAAITASKADVIVIDDPATVAAIRNWTDKSEQVLVSRLVPVLSKQIK